MSNIKKVPVTELNAFYGSARKTNKTLVNERDFYSLSYRYSGKILIEAHGKSLYSEEGSITFVPKGLSYTTEIIDDTRMVVVHFKLDDDIDSRNAAVVKTNDVGIRLLFEKLIQSFHTDSTINFYSMSVFYELLSKLDISKEGNTKRIPEKIRLIRECIERKYSDATVYIEALADEFGISTSYLRREFLRAYGITPVAFLRSVRIGNAKNMLESEYFSIAEIAEQCGFSSASYFIQVFHKIVGESPDRYRRRLCANYAKKSM